MKSTNEEAKARRALNKRKTISFKVEEIKIQKDNNDSTNEEDLKELSIRNIAFKDIDSPSFQRTKKRRYTLDKESFFNTRKKLDNAEFTEAKNYWKAHQNEFQKDEEVMQNTKKNSKLCSDSSKSKDDP